MRRACPPATRLPDPPCRDLDCDFACVYRKLSRGSQRPLSSPSFWHYFHFPGPNFLRLRRAAPHLHAAFIWEVGKPATSVQARVTRMLVSNALDSLAGTILFGISVASSSFGAFLVHDCATAAQCRSHRRCSRRHVQCLPAACVPLHRAAGALC